MTLEQTIAAITTPSFEVARRTQALLNQKTKPRGSLGKLEQLACRIAAMRGVERPTLASKVVVVMGADHGVAAEGVSAYPQAVTHQMLLNFATGGAAINVLARHAGAQLVVADLGIVEPLASYGAVRNLRVAAGTKSFVREAAMTKPQAVQALESGIALADELAAAGADVIALGEMGIGNSTSAAALAAALTGASVEDVVGRGTGVDDGGLERKRDAVRSGLSLHRGAFATGLDTLAAVGGFEIAGLAGVALGAARNRIPVLLDGFISSTAGLVAARIGETSKHFMLASHVSVEPGHRVVLRALGLEPLLELDLRLGEGTGAALALHLLEAALRIVHEMSTFEAAGVSDSGR